MIVYFYRRLDVPIFFSAQTVPAKKLARRIPRLLVAVLLLAQAGLWVLPGQQVQAETLVERPGTVIVGTANIRTGPATSYPTVDALYHGHAVYVLASVAGQTISGYDNTWYRIRFTGTGGLEMSGYIVAGFVELDPLPEQSPEPDPAFEALLDQAGFPESYRPGLRRLHATYPEWNFQALQTGLSWADAVEGMYTPGYSLITSSVNDNWKALDQEAYDWTTDTWKPYDGSSWVMSSRDLIAWTMDPRNMMRESDIFQFEILNYQPDVHHAAGVEAILANSFMSGASIKYLDPDTRTEKTISYADAFIKAGQTYDISPYHLAARSLTEVGSRGSASVTGLFSAALAAAGLPVTFAYDGYYNFYNIGASASTEPLGNVRNGLEYAKYGPDRNLEQTETDSTRLIPWNNCYRAILGGSLIIGNGYIKVGQNTLYLQKFDVDNSDSRLFWHIYMSNIAAPVSEAAKLYKAYSEMGDLHKPITFLLPVYLNMPESACLKPAASGNPNNWLSRLSVSGFHLTPTFDPAISDEYSLIVEHTVASVQVSATPVTSLATITGAGTRQLAYGNNWINVVVEAQNGGLRTYTLNIFRKYGPDVPAPSLSPSPSPAPASDPSPSPVSAGGIPSVTSSRFTITDQYITGVDPQDGQNSAENLKNGLTVPEGCTLCILNPDGTSASGLVGTGSKIQVIRQNVVLKTYIVVLYGDINGNGKINSADLNVLFLHILGKNPVNAHDLLAADANHNGKVNSADLTTVLLHVLDQSAISQP
jgi:beta-N-acetylglucosaminidase